MYIITARRMISGEVLKYRKGLCFIYADYESGLSGSSGFCLTEPDIRIWEIAMVAGDAQPTMESIPNYTGHHGVFVSGLSL